MKCKNVSNRTSVMLSALAALLVAASSQGGVTVKGDFNGDGFADLAIGVPFEDINGQPNAGVVHVLYGSANGPGAEGSQLWHQDRAGIQDTCEQKDKFGAALAVGDFDGDGFDDLAIGVAGERVGSPHRTGAVHVLWGRAGGLRAGEGLFLPVGILIFEEPDSNPLLGGSALAAGDFDNDGIDDLAIGIPGQLVAGKSGAGRVQVFTGSATRTLTLRTQIFDQASKGVLDAPAVDEGFGSALAAGDFDGDGFCDLAIGVPREKVGGAPRAGAVNVLYGRATGLHAGGDQFWTQSSIGLGGGSQRNDFFGTTLASGDFDGDGFADLAIGAPNEDGGTGAGSQASDSGAVIVLYGSVNKLSSDGSQEWNQSSGGISNSPDEGDLFGAALAAGDFDNDGRDDLAIGAPFERIGGAVAGAVHVLYGGNGGLSASGDQFWHQDQPGMLGGANAGDEFGAALGALDFNGDGFFDLVIGIPGEKMSGNDGAGAAAVLFGGAPGLTAADNQIWTQASSGIADGPGAGDGFGSALGD